MKRILFYTTISIALLIIASCNYTKKQNTPQVIDEYKVRYYYHERNCFDFTNRCDLDIVKLINNDTIIFVSSSEYSGSYEECHGKLIKINDSIYQVKSFRYIKQVCDMPLLDATDSLSFYCDSGLVGNNFNIQYPNKKIETHKIKSTLNRFWLDKRQFSPEEADLIVSFGYQHPIVNEIIELKASHHSDLRFKSKNTALPNSELFIRLECESSDIFYVVIQEKCIKTLNTDMPYNATNSPQFILERMPASCKLNSGRKLR